ncbi:MAG: tyrosine-type recombinase/integrase [Candidatus Aminicenantes bacterium]|nr:tyrosine-type recombinase/integrase [Candidatus Aminicenantes bacterium]
MKDLRLHAIRDTFGSRLIEKGANIITVKVLLGHRKVKMTERYTHADEKQKREAVENLANNSAKNSENRDNLLHHSDLHKNIPFDELMDELIIH